LRFAFLSRLHRGDSVRLIWGGGGITISGWLHDDSRERLGALADPLHPLDALSVGRLDSLPLPVAMKVEIVTVSPSKIVQFEQFHPRAGRITIEASSAVWLEACPGGWDGKTPPAASWGPRWPAGKCVAFRKGTPAKLPDAWRNDPVNLSSSAELVERPCHEKGKLEEGDACERGVCGSFPRTG
jgi:hypothetical protein